MTIRPPAVAGMFYEARPERLERDVRSYLEASGGPEPRTGFGAIVPHPGYGYSRPVAGAVHAPRARAEGRRGRRGERGGRTGRPPAVGLLRTRPVWANPPPRPPAPGRPRGRGPDGRGRRPAATAARRRVTRPQSSAMRESLWGNR